jgi:hypothetical protein
MNGDLKLNLNGDGSKQWMLWAEAKQMAASASDNYHAAKHKLKLPAT